MPSDITITSLTAVGGVGQISVSVMASSPAGMSCLPYMQPAEIEIYSGTSPSNPGAATLAGKVNSAVGVLILGGLAAGMTRYFWAIARDPAGNASARYPAGTGVAATTLTTAPGPNSVGTPELKDGAVTDEKVESFSADKLTAGTVNVTISFTSPIITGGVITGTVFRTSAIGRRIEINAADNFLRAYNSSGQYVASFGEGGIDNALVAVSRSSTANNASFVNSGSGYALATSGTVLLGGQGNRVAAHAVHTDIGASAHGFRGQAGTGGGRGLVGVSASGGAYAFFAETGAYGPFTGAHPGMLLKDDAAVPGDILVDDKVLARDGVSNTLTQVSRSGSARQRNVIGVLDSRRPFDEQSLLNVSLGPLIREIFAEKYELATVNGCGEGQVNVCGLAGDLEAGDLICTSDMPGKGQRQTILPVSDGGGLIEVADDTPRVFTVARAREAVKFTGPTDWKLVSCIYVSG